jgi:hypothetical protein
VVKVYKMIKLLIKFSKKKKISLILLNESHFLTLSMDKKFIALKPRKLSKHVWVFLGICQTLRSLGIYRIKIKYNIK